MMRKMAVWLAAAWLCGMSLALAATSGPENVLVVYNAANKSSLDLAQFYQKGRSIPAANMLGLNGPGNWADESNTTISESDYFTYIYDPIIAAITALEQGGARIDYVVLCRNLPYIAEITFQDGTTWNASVDSSLMANAPFLGLIVPGTPDTFEYNGYYHAAQTFADFKAGGYVNPFALYPTSVNTAYPSFLVTRLDGWSWNDAKNLVIQAGTPRTRSTEVFLNTSAWYDDPKKGNFPYPNDQMRALSTVLNGAGVTNELSTQRFSHPKLPASAYISFGSFDPTYSISTLKEIKFAPGALALMVGPASASDLRVAPSHPTQVDSQFSQFIAQGVTGGLAYTEPGYGDEDPERFVENYLIGGWNLADSLYSAVDYVGMVNLVIGDPLCTYLGPGYYDPGHQKGIKAGSAIGGYDKWPLGKSTSNDTGGVRTGSGIGGWDSWGTSGSRETSGSGVSTGSGVGGWSNW